MVLIWSRFISVAEEVIFMNNSGKDKKRRTQVGDVADKIALVKKLETLLILLYQAFLKGETHLDPEIKASLLRRVHFSQEFALKIRMIQSDYFDTGRQYNMGDWDPKLEVLFPPEAPQTAMEMTKERQETLEEYRVTVLKLL